MFLVDTARGRIVADDEIKRGIAAAAARTREWLDAEPGAPRATCPTAAARTEPDHETSLRRQETFGYTAEDLKRDPRPDGARRRGADRLDGHRHAAGGALRPGRSCSTTTSSSSSPR